MTAATSEYTAAPKTGGLWKSVRSVLLTQEAILAFILLALIVIVGAANPRFVSQRNLSDVLNGHAYIAIAAIGMTMVIVAGQIDISIGANIGVMAVLCGWLATSGGLPVWLAWLIPLFGGALIGAVNGFLVAYLRIPSIVATLGMFSILKGGLVIVTGGTTIWGLPAGFGLAQQNILGVPVPVVTMVVLTLLAAVWMRYYPMGRAIYALGGNREAATLSGIDIRRLLFQVFIIEGFFAGIAGVMYATQITTIQAIVPPNLELTVITAAVVGGVSILGGTGTVVGAMLAAILLNAIRSSMVFINVSPYWLRAVQGLLILVTVLVDILRRRQLRWS